MFTLLKHASTSRARLSGGQARLGLLRTPHGVIRTPAYVIVATHASVRTLSPTDVRNTKTQLVIANTYHLWSEVAPKKSKLKSKSSKIEKSFLVGKLGVSMPTMTDSGGFQVFSLGAAKDHQVGKVLKRNQKSKIKSQKFSNVRITERGVHFAIGGKKRFISPESSIVTQERLGADIIFAFDECTSPLHPQEYTKRSMERTHRWATRCLAAHTKKDQLLFGIVQGGRFKRLRTASAKAIGAMGFDGFGIGGSFGKDEMRATLAAVIPHLPDDKPRHLLGIGTVRDIFDAIEAGIDTFDCVIPTREARHARIYTDQGTIDVRKQSCANSTQKLLGSRTTIGHLHTLFRAHDMEAGLPAEAQRAKAGRLATIHNVRWFNGLMKRIRSALRGGTYGKLKRQLLRAY